MELAEKAVAAAASLFAATVVIACSTASTAPDASAPQVQLVQAGDPARGLAYAQDACASCHAIAAGQTSVDPYAPSFEEVANTPGMTGIALTAWLNTPHEEMPNLIVEPDRIDDLAAYIRTLKR